MWDRLERRSKWWDGLFRFSVAEFFGEVMPHLYLPGTFEDGGHVCESTLAVLMLLARLSAPRSLSPDLEIIFKQDQSRISRFIIKAQEHLFNTFAYTFVFDTRRLRPDIPYFAYQVGRKFGADDSLAFRVWGFLDGTFRRIARPCADQESLYSGACACLCLSAMVVGRVRQGQASNHLPHHHLDRHPASPQATTRATASST